MQIRSDCFSVRLIFKNIFNDTAIRCPISKISAARLNKILHQPTWSGFVVSNCQSQRWQRVRNRQLDHSATTIADGGARPHIENGTAMSRAHEATNHFGRTGIGRDQKLLALFVKQSAIIRLRDGPIKHHQRFSGNLSHADARLPRQPMRFRQQTIGRRLYQDVKLNRR